MKKYTFPIIILLFALFPFLTNAVDCGGAGDNRLNLCYPRFGNMSLSLEMNFGNFVAWLYYGIIAISSFAAVIMIIWGGVQWLSSAGSPGLTGDAKDRIQKALMGLLLVLTSFLIVQFLNPAAVAPEIVNIENRTRFADIPEGGGVVYLCEGNDCMGNSLLIELNSASGTGVVKSIFDLSSSPYNWGEGKTDSLTINGPLAVALTEEKNLGGRAICFDETVARLDSYEIKERNGWAGDADSAVISLKNGGACPLPGVTVLNEIDLHRLAVVFFDETEYGKKTGGSNPIEHGLPLEYFSVGTVNAEKRIDVFGSHRSADVLSILVTPEKICGGSDADLRNFGIDPGKPEACAVRLWENSKWKEEIAQGKSVPNICFTGEKPEEAADLTVYSFACNPGTDIRDDIRGVEVIPASQCKDSGIVQSCK